MKRWRRMESGRMSRRRLPIAEWERFGRLRIACFGLALCIMDWAMNTSVILCDYMMSRGCEVCQKKKLKKKTVNCS
jgi:hypothetical protein